MILFNLVLAFLMAPLHAITLEVDPEQSKIHWQGQKIKAGSEHKGTLKIKKATVNVDQNRNLLGGTIVIDMLSLENIDLSGQWKKKLETHLHSEDFFNTQKFNEAYFKIVKVTPSRSDLYSVTGNLTIRGVTRSETFDVRVIRHPKQLQATGLIEFDRQNYGVKHNPEKPALRKALAIAQDQIIKDKVQIEIDIKTRTL